jgi:hypothetical protein
VTAVLGVDVLVWVSVALLAGGVVGSLVPLVPGGLLSLGGVVLYWWQSGYTDPHVIVVAALVLVCLLVLLVDLFAGALAAKAGGASNRTTVAAGLAGFVLFFVAGPVGVLAGIAGTVFVVEYAATGEATHSARAATATTVGVLGSAVVQAMLALAVFLAMVVVVLV